MSKANKTNNNTTTIKVERKGYYRKPQRGKFPSLKMEQMIKFHSLIEYDFMYWLEFALCVVSYAAHAIKIPYPEWDEKKQKMVTRHYTPDFHLILSDGTNILVECKAGAFVDKAINQRKFQVARQWCSERNWIFVVVTEDDIRGGRRLENIKFLWRYARFQERPGLIIRVHSILSSIERLTSVRDLAQELVPEDPESIIMPLYYLTFHHQLKIPVDHGTITFHSPIFLPDQVAEVRENELPF